MLQRSGYGHHLLYEVDLHSFAQINRAGTGDFYL